MKNFLITTMMLLSMLFSAHAQTSSVISEEQALEIAKQEAIRQGADLENTESIQAFFLDEFGFWVIGFQPKSPNGGNPLDTEGFIRVSADGSKVEILSPNR